MRNVIVIYRISLFLLVLLFLGCPELSFAQSGTAPDPSNYTSVVSILPPTPNASSLGKYGGLSTNLSQGALNLSVPIYEYGSTNIKVPISLSYNSNSIRVDEIGSCVGMSWALNNGGVITRTVYGMPDGVVPRASFPAGFPAWNDSLLNYLAQITIDNTGKADLDGQPDLFSFNFNGYSGKFILDSSLANPILLTYSGLKIESHIGMTDTTWHFRVTTPDGVIYYFGGGTAVDKSTSTQIGTEKGRTYPVVVPTAYYLTKIVHPEGDSVWFTYTSNNINYKYCINESMISSTPYQANLPCDPTYAPQPNVNTNPTSYTYINSTGVLLQQINSNSGNKVLFNYSPRSDGLGQLLSTVYVYQPGQIAPFKSFALNYQYSNATNRSFNNTYTDSSCTSRPFLTSLTENSGDSSLHKTYHFNYNDFNSLPPRLSYAQDHYGYFNGKANSTLVPPPESTTYQWYVPSATANRNVDSNFCFKGLLTSIQYPTGGKDSVVYEPNYAYELVTIVPPDTIISLSAVGSFRNGPYVYDTLHVQTGQTIILYGNCTYRGSSTSLDSLHDIGWTTITDITNPSSQTTVFNQTTKVGSSWSFPFILSGGKTYVVGVDASGDSIWNSVYFNYINGVTTTAYQNHVVGGNRVKRIITADPVSNANIIKRYYYGKLNSLNLSSGASIYSPQYEKLTKYFVSCSGETTTNWTYNEFDMISVYSTTQCNLFEYGGSPITYSAVTESFGENFDNGGIEHDFTSNPDQPGNPLIGDFLLNAPRTSYSWLNGKEIYTYAFKNVAGTMIPVKKTYTHFVQDPRVNNVCTASLTTQNYIARAVWEPPIDYQFNAYDLTTYNYLQNWLYADSVVNATYDQNGQNITYDTVVTVYRNPVHAQPTAMITSQSDYNAKAYSFIYPSDTTLTGSAETARQALVAQHILSPALVTVQTRGGDTVFVERTDYNTFTNGLTLPQYHLFQVGNTPMIPRVQMYGYNNNGKILEQSKTGDAHYSYIWDYLGMYPIAQVQNASQSDIAYTSFEADGSGNWTIPDTTRNRSVSMTGNIAYNLNSSNTITSGTLNTATTYIISYWSNGASCLVNGSSGTAGAKVGNWTYYEHVVTGASSVSVSGSVTIDELRLFPKGSLMTTNTYSPLIGATSQCDPANHISYFTYDGLGRLRLVKDLYGNILKTYEYHYQNQGN